MQFIVTSDTIVSQASRRMLGFPSSARWRCFCYGHLDHFWNAKLNIFCIGPLDTEAGMATLEKCDAEVRNLVLWYYFYQFQCLMILLQAPASMLVKSGGFIFLDASGHVVHVQVLSLDKVSPVMLTFGPASEASSDVSQQWWSIRVALSLFVVLYLT